MTKPMSDNALYLAFLVSGVKLGDRRAEKALVKQCHRRFLAHSWRLMKDGQAAEDVVQQAWMEIFRSLPKLHDDHLFLPWAYRIVSRAATQWIKRQQKRRKLTDAAEREYRPETVPDGSEDKITLEQAISALPNDHQAALALFYNEGFSVAEISVALNIPPGTVKSRLSNARQKLRIILERK